MADINNWTLLLVILTMTCNHVIKAERHVSQPRRVINIGVMAPTTGSRAWWGWGITLAAEMAMSHINSRNDILNGYELKLLSNDTKGETGLGNNILFDYITNQKVLLVLGPARSNVALSVADTAKYWELITVSASAETGDLSDSQHYPYYFRTIPSLSATSMTFVALAKRFGWSNVAILYYSRDMYIRAAGELKTKCEEHNITVLSYGSYLTNANSQLRHIKDIDARVIFAFLQRTTSVSCQIYNHGLYGRKYAWVVNTPDQDGWWNRTYDIINCSAGQVNEAVQHAILVKHMYISQSPQTTISGLSPQAFTALYNDYTASKGAQVSEYGAFSYDAAWLVAMAINSSLSELPVGTRLESFRHTNVSRTIRESLLKARFTGLSGEVKLKPNGDRSGIFEIFQLRGSSVFRVANHSTTISEILLYKDMDFEWIGNRPPSDRIRVEVRLLHISEVLVTVMCSLAAAGILVASGFLYFNITNRKSRFIKMSSPNLNNAIIVGCILSYLSLIFFAMDGERLTTPFCKGKVLLVNVGFTVAFGAMFAKTWRVYRITRKLRPKRRVISDYHLFMMIGGFLLVDTIIFLTWSLVDPLTKDTKYLKTDDSNLQTGDEDIIFQPEVHYCRTSHVSVWYTLVYGYKAIILLFGLFLAWETRKVKISAINDSHYIGLAVYNVFLVCVIGVSVQWLLDDRISYQLSFIITTICVFSSTTMTLCLVFVPKITGLKRIALLGDQKVMQPSVIDLYETEVSGKPCSCKRQDKETSEELTRLQTKLHEVERERNQLLFRSKIIVSKTIYV